MAVGFFLDKTHPPTLEEVYTSLGENQNLWRRLVKFLADNYALEGEWNFGGKNYGWNLWYRRSGKSLTSLYPQKNEFIAQVVLGKEEVNKAMDLELGDYVGKCLRETPQLHDGKWLFLHVKTESSVVDVEKLLIVKRRPIKKKILTGEIAQPPQEKSTQERVKG